MTEVTDPATHEHPLASEPPPEEDVKTRALDAIADLISVTIQNATPGSFARAQIYCGAAADIEQGPKASREDYIAQMMPMITDVMGNYFANVGPSKKSKLFDELHQLAHTREMIKPSDKEALKALDDRISEIAKLLGPEQTAAVLSIAPEAP